MGIQKNFPSLAHLAVPPLRCKVAGELAGAWGDVGGIRPHLTNLANAALVAFATNQEAAAKLNGAQNAEWLHLARGRRDPSKVEQQLMGPHQPRKTRTLAEQGKAYELRAQKPYAGRGDWKWKGFQRKEEAEEYPYTKEKKGRSYGAAIFVITPVVRRGASPSMRTRETGSDDKWEDGRGKKKRDDESEREEWETPHQKWTVPAKIKIRSFGKQNSCLMGNVTFLSGSVATLPHPLEGVT